jgi:serine protease
MSGSGDADFYRVSLPAGKRLTATMTPNANSDYELYLYNSSGTAIAWSENGRGLAETVTVTNSGTSAVTYYVRVHYYGGGTGSTSGTYSIRLSW